LLSLGTFLLGVEAGKKYERDRFEVVKGFAPVEASEYLAKGEFDKGLSRLHFLKSFEPRVGWTDAELGKAYLAKGQPCLAQDFLESGLEWMTREKLTELSMFASAQDALPKATAQCVATRQTTLSVTPR
jgi:hypothetical protein